jgi:hypothetical protein
MMRQTSLVLVLFAGLACGFLAGAIFVRVSHAWRDVRLVSRRVQATRREAWTSTGLAVRLGMAFAAVVILMACTHVH